MGFFLLSFFLDVEATLARLPALGFDQPARRIRFPGPGAVVDMATVRDPDGVLVELVGTTRMPTERDTRGGTVRCANFATTRA